MSRTLKVYWWRGGPNAGNFGDQLNRFICEAVHGANVQWAPPGSSDLIAIGSVLEPWFWKPSGTAEAYKGTIWGAGRMSGIASIAFPKANIVALRGHLSRHSLDATCPVGDPGLLVPLLKSELPTRRRTYEVGIVPHWTERDSELVRRLDGLSPQVKVIDPCAPVMEVIEKILSCKRILSSAMHGLIVADALGVPNRWIRFRRADKTYRGFPDFKYRDYYSAFGKLDICPAHLIDDESLESLVLHTGVYTPPELSGVQKSLMDAFPQAMT